MLTLKIDVDTYEGMTRGVPRLLDCLARRQVPATFFLALGPDRSGLAMYQALKNPRFVAKMISTRAPALYGWRTILSGTLLPARTISLAGGPLVRRMEAEGHETAIHGWDHRAWQDRLPKFSPRRIRRHLHLAVEAYRELTGHDPKGFGAPGWVMTLPALEIVSEFPFAYASDLRYAPPCRLRTERGLLRLPQLPANGSCLEELLSLGIREPRQLEDRLFRDLVESPGKIKIFTAHAEVEGGPYLPLFDRLLSRLREAGPFFTLDEASRRLDPNLPLLTWCQRRIPGRAFPVSSAR